MRPPQAVLSLSLIDGFLPTVFLALGVVALLWLGIAGRKLGLRTILVFAIVAAGSTALLYVLAEHIFLWWNASLPRTLYVYSALAVLGFQLAFRQVTAPGTPAVRRAAGVLAALALLGALACTVNLAYAQYPTVRSLLDPPSATDDPLPRPADAGADRPAASEQNWSPPPDMPGEGQVYRAEIPAAGSGYASHPALIYLPPAYLADPGAVSLPVLVLIHGQPGSPNDWLVSGRIAEMMDGFAARHAGLAPVVVMPDASNDSNPDWPLCLDTSVSDSATYLARDLPAWVQQQLGAGTAGARQWAVAGYSFGGTCAVQLAANHPDVYPTFLDIAGENEPTDAEGHQALLDTYFGGDERAFAEQNAVDRFRRMSFPELAGIVVVGREDKVYAPEGRQVYEAARAAGADVQLQELPGGHSWQVWRAGLENNLDWLSRRLGILDP
ncbi:alpha/beta hydrolase [Arthrobacter zhaoxinii]|uniref:alpha/beta hydrolase n=1 Tax=Arthrobacter zhaoxinii TaxID=2964616 RepID=UPI0021083E6F|nr:alpha/beta hydrolase-fold protein [Arthrobacter zhaoxinii]MCQ2000224.1 alpha/beta hydrolase-fold protein [Arthrobacter zhaoxinii]